MPNPRPDPPPPSLSPTVEPAWTFPDILPGTEVDCCKQADFVNVMSGTVGKVFESHCSVMAIHPTSGERIPIPGCYHIDDPRVKAHPELHGTGYDGFFRLSVRETERQRMVQQFAAFDERTQAHEVEIADLKKRMKAMEKPKPMKVEPDSGK